MWFKDHALKGFSETLYIYNVIQVVSLYAWAGIPDSRYPKP